MENSNELFTDFDRDIKNNTVTRGYLRNAMMFRHQGNLLMALTKYISIYVENHAEKTFEGV